MPAPCPPSSPGPPSAPRGRLFRCAGRPRRHRWEGLAPVGLLVGVLAVLAGCGSAGSSAPPGSGTVERVVDGDTVEVRIGRRTETVRLLGIDTPETVKPDAPVECYGPEASARAKALLAPGTEVRLTRDEEVRDRYDRLLAYVTRVEDDTMVNRVLVAEGFARTLSIAPNDAHEADLARAQAEARAAGRGLWGACPPEG